MHQELLLETDIIECGHIGFKDQAVAIFKSVGGKITTAEDQFFYANQSIFTGDSEANAEFGSWFSVLNGNLIIGSPGRTVSGLANAGAFYYLDL